MQLVARDRMREIKLWSKFKKQFDDGSFDTKDVNTPIKFISFNYENKAETLTQGSSQPEVFNVLGQLQSIERIKKENGQIEQLKNQYCKDLHQKDKKLFLVAMPRSGNTLFASIMNQNPEIAAANSITLEIMKDLFC